MNAMTEEIATPRLKLRRPVVSDAARIAELAGDYDVARMTTRMPHPYSVQDATGWLEGLNQSTSSDQAAFALIEPRAGLIGVLGFHQAEPAGATEIGYWLGRPWWGRGFATEAAKAALAWAKTSWRRRWLVSGHFADNVASGQVLCKAGFLYTGEVQLRHSAARGEPAATRMMVWLA